MKIKDIVREAAETLRECEALNGVPVIEEDVGDYRAELDAEIGKRDVCVVIGWNGFTPVIQGTTAPDETPVGTVGITARVYENPERNRTGTLSLTASDLAIAIAGALNGAMAEGMEAPVWLKSVGKAVYDGGRHSVVTCEVNFETKAGLR